MRGSATVFYLFTNSWCMWRHKKIIKEEGYKKLIVITSPDMRHICVKWLQQQASNLGVELVIQAKSLMEDFCTFLGATNLVLYFSTLGDNAAVLNARLKCLYVRNLRTRIR